MIETKWGELKLEGWNEERKQWCQIVDMDIRENRIGLNNGHVTFWQQLDTTKMRRYEPGYAESKWVPEDIRQLKPEWSLEQCEEWLQENERHIQGNIIAKS